MSVCKAAMQYMVPESTLRDRTRGKVPLEGNPGPERIFTHGEEEQLVDHIEYMASIGYGYTKANIQYLSADFAMTCGKKDHSEKPLSDHWFYGFMKRWPNLKLAKPQKLSTQRAKSASRDTLNKYFQELSTILTINNLHDKPGRIYNIDETGVNTEHNPPKIVCNSNSQPQAITSCRSSTITIIGGGNALGNHIPPYYVFPGKRWNPAFLEGTQAGADGEITESGWSNSRVFVNYLTGHFSKHAGIVQVNPQPTLILYDGHKSHISLTLVNWAKNNNIILFVLPPHSSHLTQPLDIGVFGPFKNMYSRECQQYLQKHPGLQITKYEIGKLTCKPYMKAMSPENLSAAFRKSGIYPFSNSTISDIQIAPSSIYQRDMPENESPSSSTTFIPTEDPSSLHSAAPENFFKSRTITSVIRKPKKKFTPPFLAGCLHKKQNISIMKKSESKFKTPISKKPAKEIRPSDTRHDIQSSPQPGPSCINIVHTPFEDADTEDQMDTDEETCCVCHKIEPPAIKDCVNLIIVKWAKCDKCEHWTHLYFCCSTTTVRRHSSFCCPHCL